MGITERRRFPFVMAEYDLRLFGPLQLSGIGPGLSQRRTNTSSQWQISDIHVVGAERGQPTIGCSPSKETS